MRKTGMLLWIAGVALAAYAAFIFNTSLDGSVVNLDLQQKQALMMIAGAALFVAGVLLHALSTLQPKKAHAVKTRKAPKPPMQDFSKIDA